jgi:alkyl sulfatase BDS1-like metallo-beta-lactamase superfamily hydrolase
LSQGFDGDRARAAFRKLLADAPDHAAQGFVRLVRGAGPERLQQVMRSPARIAVLEGIFWQMPQRFDPARAAGIESTVRWCITGRADGGVDIYELQIVDGRCRVRRGGRADRAQLTITLDGAELVLLATGQSDPMQAYFKRRLKLAGDIMLAAKLARLFRIPARPGPQEPA